MKIESKKLISGEDYIIEDDVLIIKEGITVIPACSFKEFYRKIKITSIILPSTLLLIESAAFELCGSINNLVIPDSVRYIMNEAFCHCNIYNLTLGKNVTYIGSHAFCDNYIESVTNNSGKLKLIDVFAFGENHKLVKFNFNKTSEKTFIEESAFYEAPIANKLNDDNSVSFNINKIYSTEHTYYPSYVCCFETTDRYTYKDGVLKINKGIEVIGSFDQLKDCTSVELPDSVIIIQPWAFNNLTKLKSIKMSNNIMSIGEDAFLGCKIEEKPLKMPSSLCYMDLSAFKNNGNTNRILVPHNMGRYCNKYDDDFPVMYENYYNDLTDRLETNTKTIDIVELLEEERKLLESLNLLPETIEENKKLNKLFSSKQLEIARNAFLDFINSPLYDENNNIQYVIKILELKEINICNEDSIVYNSFKRKQIKTIYLLLSYGYDFTYKSLISRAIICDLYELIDVLLLIGVDINEIGVIGMTPLSIACQKGDINLVKHLIEKGAAINMVDSMNKKAIDYATENNFQEIIDLINSYNFVENDETEKDINVLKKILG